MAIDRKYGRVTTERGTIGDDEPVVIFRAQDALLPQLLVEYLRLCEAAGSPDRHLQLVRGTRDEVIDWQQKHHHQVPRSDALKPGKPRIITVD